MESAVKREPVTLGWKLAMLTPLAVALALLLLSRRQHELHSEILFSTLGNMLTMVSMIVMSIYWIVEKKLVGWGIMMLIFASAVLGFGLHTLLRTVGG
jgi:drug/metabolite transporter (DMT)-like permease